MFFNANSQWWISLILIGTGFLCGAFFNLASTLNILFKNRFWIKCIFDFVATIICGTAFLIAINILYYGEMRLYMIVAFVLGLYLEIVTVGKIIAKTFLLLYNKTAIWIKKLSNTKFGKRITK